MKVHQGLVAVESEVNRGTTFELLFPAMPETALADRDSVEQSSDLQHVLFVDDDEARVVLARRAFSRLGHRISAFSSSFEALDAFRKTPDDYDVVVIDHNMPHFDAPTWIEELRRIRPDVCVILTTSYVRADDVAMAAKLGISRLLEKPQSLDDLATLVELQLSSS